MRLRNIPGANEAVASSPYCIQNPSEDRGQWHAFLQSASPIHVEIGMGKGRFLMDLAEQNPDHFAVRQYAKYKLAAGVIR